MTLDKEMVEFSQQVFKNFGVDNLSSKIIGILFSEPGELSLDELANKTGYSLPSVSNKTRFLERLEVIHKIKKPGSKRVHYHMEKDLFRIMEKKLEKSYEAEINPAKEKVPKIINKHKNKKLSEKSRKRLQLLENYYNQILKMDKFFNEFHSKLKKMQNGR